MIEILSISGSPVENASTDIILERISQSVINGLKENRQQVELSFYKLNELSFIPCQACGKAPSPEFCFYNEINDIYEKLAKCDCLLFGSPIYFDSVSAQAKLFIDRCNCFRPVDFNNINPEHHFIKIIKRNRPGAMVLVGGKDQWYEGARRVIAGFFKWIEVTNTGLISYSSPDDFHKGAAADDMEIMKKASMLGEQIVSILIKKS